MAKISDIHLRPGIRKTPENVDSQGVLISRARRTRTLNKGFGDPRVTITPLPYLTTREIIFKSEQLVKQKVLRFDRTSSDSRGAVTNHMIFLLVALVRITLKRMHKVGSSKPLIWHVLRCHPQADLFHTIPHAAQQ